MTYSSNVTGQIEGIRQQTVSVLDEVISRAGEFELAGSPPEREVYRPRFEDGSERQILLEDLPFYGSPPDVPRVKSTPAGVVDRGGFRNRLMMAKRPGRTYPNQTTVR